MNKQLLIILLGILICVSSVSADEPGIEIINISDSVVDTDDDSLYNFLVLELTVNVSQAGEYEFEAILEDGLGETIATIDDYELEFNAGENTVQLYFNGIEIYANEANGQYELNHLEIEGEDFEAEYEDLYNTSSYNYEDFQRPRASFTEMFSDYGYDEDEDGYYDYLTVEAEIDVTSAGNYIVWAELTISEDDVQLRSREFFYLEEGIQTVQLNFSGVGIYLSGVNGPYHPIEIKLYDKDYEVLSDKYDYTTSAYSYTDFQRPYATFTGNFLDYGYDRDDDGLYDYLTIEAEINVTKVGQYIIESRIQYPDSTTYNYFKSFDLVGGLNIIHINLDGIDIYKKETNGVYVLYNLKLYDRSFVLMDYLGGNVYTTSSYDYEDFQRPTFTGVFSDYGYDQDGDSLYDYLTVEAEVNITKAGNYGIEARLKDQFGREITEEEAELKIYLDAGVHNIQLNFDGNEIYEHGENGNYTLSWLHIDNEDFQVRLETLDEDIYITSYYDYVKFEHEIEEPFENKLKIKDIKVEVNGKKESGADENGGTIDKDVYPGSEITIEIELENLFDDKDIEDIAIEGILENIDDGDDVEDDDEITKIKSGDTESVTLRFKVPLEVGEDDYDLAIKAEGKDEDGNNHQASVNFKVDVEKKSHDILIQTAVLSPSALSCIRSASLEIGILNLGKKDEEDVVIKIKNSALGIDLTSEGIELDAEPDKDNKYSETFQLDIGGDVKEGLYPITIQVYYDKTHLITTKTINLIVKDCIKLTSQSQETVTLSPPPTQSYVVGETAQLPQTLTREPKLAFTDTSEYLVLLALTFVILLGLAVFLTGTAIIRFSRK